MNPSRSSACGRRCDRIRIVLAQAFRKRHPAPGRRRGDGRDQAAAQPSGRHRERDGGAFRLDGNDHPARSTQGRHRACIAQRRAGGARPRGEVHDGIEPATGLTARHQIVRGGLETRGRRRHAEQPRDDAPDVDVERRDRDPEGRRRDRSRRVRPDPGQGIQFGDRLGHATAMVRDDLPCTFAQREGAPVVTEPRPRGQQLVSTGPGEVDRRRPTIDESPPCRPDALDPGLLRHHLGDEHLPRVRSLADQQRPTSRLVPPEQAAVQAAPAHGFHLAEDSLRCRGVAR